MERHPSAAVGSEILGVAPIRGKMPVDQEVKSDPPNRGESALTQTHRNGHCGAERAGPNEDLDDILNHKCELARFVPLSVRKVRQCWNMLELSSIQRLLICEMVPIMQVGA